MHETDKIIFTGPMGAGKTTAISSISDKPPVNTDVNCSGNELEWKKTTTVAMDYSFIQLEEGKRIHLYGTPGQQRFDFMWNILTKGGIGLVLLINNDHPDPIQQLDYYLDSFSQFINETAVVIGITRMGIDDKANIENYYTKLNERRQVFPVFEIDCRNQYDIKILVHALLSVLNSD